MKTVGEFKKAGLVFVKGDVVDDSYDNDGTLMKTLSATMVECCNDGKYQFNEAAIESFAWRESTGVKPEFSGLVDYMEKNDVYIGNDCIYTNHTDTIDWTEHCCSHQVKKWRPSLNQPSVAGRETKESAIHKAWVALKGDIKNLKNYSCSTNNNGILLYKVDSDTGLLQMPSGYYYQDIPFLGLSASLVEICLMSEFTNYCEKMAAEEKRMIEIMQNGNDGLHYDNTAQQVVKCSCIGCDNESTHTWSGHPTCDDCGTPSRSEVREVVNHTLLKPKNPESIFKSNEGAQKSLNEHLAKLADDKPIFTQAMAVNGELPPVGSECILNLAFDSYPAKVTYIGNGVGCFINLNNGEEYSFAMKDTSFKPLDTRTDREKAIDDMFEDAKVQGSKGAFERLYDAGYRKC